MFTDKGQTKANNADGSVKSELHLIVEKLAIIVANYEAISLEIASKLNFIKLCEEPPLNKPNERPTPQCVTDEINNFLYQLNDLNEFSKNSLNHLGKII